jgi:hypothetical protein
MRTRTIFIILLILVLLIALGPALLAVGSQEVAEVFGCQVDLNRVILCIIGGEDYDLLRSRLFDLVFVSHSSHRSRAAGFGRRPRSLP